MSSRSIVKDSTKLREALRARWKELGLTQEEVAKDAVERGQTGIYRAAINKYLNHPYNQGALNEQQIIWLGWRWFVPVTLSVGIPNKKKVKFEVPAKYSEKKALKLLNEMFPEK